MAQQRVCRFACIGLTREHATRLSAILDLLQPKLHCHWQLTTLHDAELIFHPQAFIENVRMRLHAGQRLVAVWHDEEPPHGDEWHLEWPFRVGPVLTIVEQAEQVLLNHSVNTPLNQMIAPPNLATTDLSSVLKSWLRTRSLPHWHLMTSKYGNRLWVHAATLEYASSPNTVASIPSYWQAWNLPLPVGSPPPSASERGHLNQLLWTLIQNPKLPKPDWMFQDGLEIRLTGWPDLGEVDAPHWQIKAVSLLSLDFFSLQTLAERTDRDVQDIAGLALATDVLGLLEHRQIQVKGLVDQPKAESLRLAAGSQAVPAAGLVGLLRSIRDRLYGNRLR